MPVIRPFRSYRPAPGLESRIAALPYDVYSRQEALAEVKARPGSFLEIDRPETAFSPDTDMYAPKVYEKAASLLREWIASGRLIQDPSPCYYIYQQVMEGITPQKAAAACGFNDYTSFYRAFRTEYDMSPKEYAQRWKERQIR